MQKAIEVVFPNTLTLLVFIHIMKVTRKDLGCRMYEHIQNVLHYVVYDSLTKEFL